MVVVKRAEAVEEKEIKDLDLLVKKSELIIFRAVTKAPFRFLQDEITICMNRVTVVDRGLFYYDEYPMPIEGINGARVIKSLFSAQLHIDTFGVQKPPPLTHMSIADARLARRYILALIECKKNGVDLSVYPMKEIREKLKKLGMVREGSGEDHFNI